MIVVEFTIRGEPVPKARPRVTRFGTYTPKTTVDFERTVRNLAQIATKINDPETGPVKVTIHVRKRIPKSWSKQKTQDALHGILHPISRPDLDNLAKSITDAMNQIVYMDDSQIVQLNLIKEYSETARTTVTVEKVQGKIA